MQQHGNPLLIGAMALLLFPKLALGLSGFETGVAVMPLVRGDASDTEERPAGRIRNTKKLLRTAALIMSVMLIGSSFVTALLIPAGAFQPGGPAEGRALAYLAHERFGPAFGTVYAAYALYQFIGATTTFFTLGAIGLACMGAASLHGPALAGLGLAGSRVVLFVGGLAVEQDDHVGVLLDRARLTQVAKRGELVGALLGTTVQLRQGDDRHLKLLREKLERSGELADLLLAALDALAARVMGRL